MFNKNSVGGTFLVAGGLCLIASLLVSTAAIGLKPIQDKNKALDKKKNILIAAGLYENPQTVDKIFEDKINAKVVDLATGEYATTVDSQSFDARKAAKDPKQNVVIPENLDIARIKTRAKYAVVYEVKGSGGGIERVVLPIYGKGLWSTLYGFLAIDSSDASTVKGIGFYEHAETPGLGGEIDNPKWKAHWPGKKVYDAAGHVKIDVIKGSVDNSKPQAVHQVDGISGATLTGRGVGHLVQYWLGDEGFAKYLKKLKTH